MNIAASVSHAKPAELSTSAAGGAKISLCSFKAESMTDIQNETPPDRLASDIRSPFFNETALERGIGVRFKGNEYTNVSEYCVSEGWIRLPVGKSLDRRGNAMTFKHIGPVEVWYLT
jgi:hypothetical protein